MSNAVTVSREYVAWLREQRAAWTAQGLNWKGEPCKPTEETL